MFAFKIVNGAVISIIQRSQQDSKLYKPNMYQILPKICLEISHRRIGYIVDLVLINTIPITYMMRRQFTCDVNSVHHVKHTFSIIRAWTGMATKLETNNNNNNNKN